MRKFIIASKNLKKGEFFNNRTQGYFAVVLTSTERKICIVFSEIYFWESVNKKTDFFFYQKRENQLKDWIYKLEYLSSIAANRIEIPPNELQQSTTKFLYICSIPLSI